MQLYLVYEFIYNNLDECITEEIQFIGLYRSKSNAIDVANKQVRLGEKNYDVVISKEVTNTISPFSESNSIEMCREDYNNDDTPIYSINIKELKIK